MAGDLGAVTARPVPPVLAAVLGCAAAPALLGATAPVSPAAVTKPVAASGNAFVAPPGAMLFSRTLRRPLPDGAEFAVTRSYRIEFVRDGDGFRVDGVLVDVAVHAPEALAAFAELERNRPDTGMFPLRLDAAGLLQPSQGAASGAEVHKAVEMVVERLGERHMPALDMLEAQAFVQGIRQRPAVSQWPADVFRPRSLHLSRGSDVPLPGGQAGHITVDITARTQGHDGLMAEMSRTVTTDLGGDVRHTYETWTLVPAGR